MFELLGETLRRIRKERGKTLEQVGKQAGLGRGQLSRIENGRQEATLSTLGKILTSEGVSRREFFRRYDLVEAEALEVERAARGGEPGGELAQGNWPEEVQSLLHKVESFVQITLHQPRPVAQGAFEMGDFVVLFRVLPKNPPEPEPSGGQEAQGEPSGAARSGGRGRKKKTVRE
ncbi:MAG TPA: helix-turn-helix transcriptional regulator [Thermoanaerobaculia bacterium]|nr:helix-turn-helix transcriptional regulator [Thermoanaerobaculia bacterium]